MDLEMSVAELKGVGPAVKDDLSKAGVKTVADLVAYYPRRYEDYSLITPVAEIRPGKVTIQAEIKQIKGRYVRRGMHITEAVASDESGNVRLVWFNQPYRAKATKSGAKYFVSGEFQLSASRLSIMNPSTELVSDFPVNTARIVPIYPQTKSLKSLQLRKLVRSIVPEIRKLHETLPSWLIREQKLISRAKATELLHFPKNAEDVELAKKRLGFEEVFELTLAALLNKQEVEQVSAIKIDFDEKLAKDFVVKLPFKLTDAQRKAIWQIYLDLQKPHPMNRLLEGDVGSGKTVVAAMAALMVMSRGYQVALMAPTEILARQHANTIVNLLKPLGLAGKTGLLVSSMSAKQKKTAHAAIASGKLKFIVGTHALIQDKIVIDNLGLIIIDEQHRFGVDQRLALQAKAKLVPHILTMTATPIPRSLALTVYGELDITILDQMPAGRSKTVTKICSPNSINPVYESIEQLLTAGRQAFVVCPLISDSEYSKTASAESVYELLSKSVFKKFKVGLLHGRQKSDEKESVMQDFVDGKLNILVSTTVIEVGVDVPNASVMMVQAADRFGLAQIHQLRGRVGRGEHKGYCYLVMSDSSAPNPRLRALEATNDGFKLAELDLQIRGPGAIYGYAQHGQLDLKVASLTDSKQIASARSAAQKFIDKDEDLLKYPQLKERIQKLRKITNLN